MLVDADKTHNEYSNKNGIYLLNMIMKYSIAASSLLLQLCPFFTEQVT